MSRKPITLDDVARTTGGRVVGDGGVRVRDVAPLADAGPDDLALLADRRYLPALEESRAGALLVQEALLEQVEGTDVPAVVVADAHRALVPLLELLHPPAAVPVGIHPTAVLGRGVSLGTDVWVGPYAVLGDGVVVADRARVGPHAAVGDGCRIGEESVLNPGVVLYAGTVVGRRVVVHAGARLGVDGFGYAVGDDGAFRKIPQVGRVVVEDDVEIGANACIDRGSIGDTVVGAGSKLDNLVHLAHNVRLGAGCAFAAMVGVAGSVRIGRGVVAGGQAGISGHLSIGDGARLAAQAGVIGDIPAGETWMGYPARERREFLKAEALTYRLPDLVKEVRRLRKELDELRSTRDGGADET